MSFNITRTHSSQLFEVTQNGSTNLSEVEQRTQLAVRHDESTLFIQFSQLTLEGVEVKVERPSPANKELGILQKCTSCYVVTLAKQLDSKFTKDRECVKLFLEKCQYSYVGQLAPFIVEFCNEPYFMYELTENFGFEVLHLLGEDLISQFRSVLEKAELLDSTDFTFLNVSNLLKEKKTTWEKLFFPFNFAD